MGLQHHLPPIKTRDVRDLVWFFPELHTVHVSPANRSEREVRRPSHSRYQIPFYVPVENTKLRRQILVIPKDSNTMKQNPQISSTSFYRIPCLGLATAISPRQLSAMMHGAALTTSSAPPRMTAVVNEKRRERKRGKRKFGFHTAENNGGL